MLIFNQSQVEEDKESEKKWAEKSYQESWEKATWT